MAEDKLHPCARCAIGKLSVFYNAEQDSFPEFEKEKTILKKGSFLFKERQYSQGVFCLRKGKMLIQKCGYSNEPRPIAVAQPSEILGVSSILSEHRYSTTALALEQGEACVISKGEFEKLVQKHPHVMINTIRMISEKLNRVESRTGLGMQL